MSLFVIKISLLRVMTWNHMADVPQNNELNKAKKSSSMQLYCKNTQMSKFNLFGTISDVFKNIHYPSARDNNRHVGYSVHYKI